MEEPDDLRPASFDEEESADLRRQFVRYAIRLTVAFAVLFGGVFLAFWWSGAAVRFSASRVGDRGTPSWRVTGVVRNASTHEPVPWAVVEDDAAGRPPLFRADANQAGQYELMTLAEPHQLRITAPGYQTKMLSVGRVWFLWLPRGGELHDVELQPDR